MGVQVRDVDHVALPPLARRGQFADINAADPITRNRDGRRRFPLALAEPLLSDGRVRLHFALERAQARNLPPSCAAVEAGAVNVERELGGRVRADENTQGFPGATPRAL